MKRLIRLACALVLAAMAALPTAVRAQACSFVVDPVLDFGTVLELPTPATAVTARIIVTCGVDERRVCVGIGAGTGFGSTEEDRRMSIVAAPRETVGYALFKDPAFTDPFGSSGNDRATVVFTPTIPGEFQAITIYGRLTPGQDRKAVGEYLSTLLVVAESFNDSKPNCNGNGFREDTDTFQAHVRIGPICSIVVAPLHFGTLSELTGTSGTTNMAVTCSLGAPYSVGLDGGLIDRIGDRRMQHTSGVGSITYQLYRDPAHSEVWGDTRGTSVDGTGTGVPQSIPVYGFVPAQLEPPAGAYSDTITATVTY